MKQDDTYHKKVWRYHANTTLWKYIADERFIILKIIYMDLARVRVAQNDFVKISWYNHCRSCESEEYCREQPTSLL